MITVSSKSLNFRCEMVKVFSLLRGEDLGCVGELEGRISPEPAWVLSVGRIGEVLCAGMGLSGWCLRESPLFNTKTIC